MKHTEKFSASETMVGKYSARKIPRWRQLGQNEIMQYLDAMMMQDELEDLNYGTYGP